MTTLRIRNKAEIRFQFPANVVRIVRPSISRAMHAVRAHYARRHMGAEYRQAVRNWADEVRRIDSNTAYSTALAQTQGKLKTPPIWKPEA